jgi:hypothetical protein
MFRRTRFSRGAAGLVAVILISALAATAGARAGLASDQATGLSAPAAPAPLVLNYQGRLADPVTGAAKPDGTYQMAFALYDVETGGVALWTETRDVTTKNGLFSIRLGEVTAFPAPPIFDGRALWLAITVGADPQATPRLPVSFVAYALYANYAASAGIADNAAQLGGQPPANYATATHTHDAGAISAGTLSTDRFSAYADLAAETKIGAAAGQVAAGNHTHNASAITAGTFSTDRFSAYADLAAEGSIGEAAGQVATGNHTHTGATIVDSSISTADLADESVTSAKIADGNVANADLAANSVDGSKIADLSIGAADLAAGAVTLAKINTTGATTNEVIQYDGTKAAWGYAPGSEIRYRTMPADCVSVASFAANTWTKVADLGSVSKLDATSRLEITFNGRINAQSLTGTGALFELRLDDTATTNGRARASMKAAETGGVGVPVSIMGIFTGYGAGAHTINLWLYSYYGTGTYGGIDPGCYAADHIVVREIK